MSDYQGSSPGGYHGFEYPSEVSASCLTYLFADRFVRPMSRSRRFLTGDLAVTTPTSGTLVRLAEVQRHCMATALWSLEHQGFIKIAETSSGGRKGLTVEKRRASPEMLGLDGLLLRAIPYDPIVLKNLVCSNAFVSGGVDVELVPIQEEAVKAKVAVLSKRDGRIPSCLKWSKHARYEIREVDRRSLNAQFRSADEAGLFGRDQPQLFKKVLAQCGLAIRRVTTTTGGVG